jgi:hypothetical protein
MSYTPMYVRTYIIIYRRNIGNRFYLAIRRPICAREIIIILLFTIHRHGRLESKYNNISINVQWGEAS